MRDWAERNWLAVVAALAIAGLATIALAGALTDAGAGDINGYGMLAFAIITVPVVLWGTVWRQRQAAASRRQAETSHREVLDSRLRHGAEMMFSEHAGIRAAGEYLLNSLAKEYPDDYAELVAQIRAAAKRKVEDDGADDSG